MFNLSPITDFLTAIVAIVAFVAAIAYAWAIVKGGAYKAMKENNQALTERIEILEKSHEENKLAITRLETKLEHVEKQNDAYVELIQKALVVFFQNNPTEARILNTSISKQRSKKGAI